MSELGRFSRIEAFHCFFEGHAGEDFLDESGHPFGFGRTRHDRVDSDCRALGELGKTAGQRELHGLRRAVVDHLGRGADVGESSPGQGRQGARLAIE
jgi:hypothetical protein